jgi:hypothetical protein
MDVWCVFDKDLAMDQRIVMLKQTLTTKLKMKNEVRVKLFIDKVNEISPFERKKKGLLSNLR